MTYIFKNDSFLSFRCTSEEFHNFFTNIVIPNRYEESHEKYTFNRRFFGTSHLRMTLLRGGLHHRIEIRRVIPLRMTRDLLGGGFFLLAVVRMTFGSFRYIRESLIGNKKVCSKSEQTFLLPMRKRSIRTR